MTRKALPIYFEGNKIVRISDLPMAQSSLFSGWVQPSQFLVMNEQKDLDLVKYEEYEYWYQKYFMTEKDLDNIL